MTSYFLNLTKYQHLFCLCKPDLFHLHLLMNVSVLTVHREDCIRTKDPFLKLGVIFLLVRK